jgi:hypothetical protein
MSDEARLTEAETVALIQQTSPIRVLKCAFGPKGVWLNGPPGDWAWEAVRAIRSVGIDTLTRI